MARVGLVVDTEFLRLVLRQLLRKIPGIELIGEASDPVEALTLPPADALIVDVSTCAAGPLACTRCVPASRGPLFLIGNGPSVERAGISIPPGVIRIPMGTATAARDLSLLASRLEGALRPLAARRPAVSRSARPTRLRLRATAQMDRVQAA